MEARSQFAKPPMRCQAYPMPLRWA